MYLDIALIVSNKKMPCGFFHLVLKSKKIANRLTCGQFVFLRIENNAVLLRRPLSVAWISGSSINIIYKVVGEGTKLLAEKKAGMALNAMGPLGNGFCLDKGKNIIVVAGGVGIAPITGLLKQVKRRNIKLFYGARTKSEFIPESLLSIEKKDIIYVTEDGTKGEKGFVTDALKAFVSTCDPDNMFMYACGPQAMLKAVTKIAKKFAIAGQASLEERMACGVGACLGCATETKNGMKMVCKDGPVFSFDELL